MTRQVAEASSWDGLVLLWDQLPGVSSASHRSPPNTDDSAPFFSLISEHRKEEREQPTRDTDFINHLLKDNPAVGRKMAKVSESV